MISTMPLSKVTPPIPQSDVSPIAVRVVRSNGFLQRFRFDPAAGGRSIPWTKCRLTREVPKGPRTRSSQRFRSGATGTRMNVVTVLCRPTTLSMPNTRTAFPRDCDADECRNAETTGFRRNRGFCMAGVAWFPQDGKPAFQALRRIGNPGMPLAGIDGTHAFPDCGMPETLQTSRCWVAASPGCGVSAMPGFTEEHANDCGHQSKGRVGQDHNERLSRCDVGRAGQEGSPD